MQSTLAQPQRPQTAMHFSHNNSKSIDRDNQLSLRREKTIANEAAWRAYAQNDINKSAKLIERSNSSVYLSKLTDPLTSLREVLRTLSNMEAFKYMRQCRLIVARLKKCWVDLNEEIKSLTRHKTYLESAIEHIRKDLIINKEITDGRLHRSSTEPDQDKVDDILDSEKKNLQNLKRNLELILQPIQEHLYKLDDIRETVDKLYKERSVVTDLICQCLTQSIRSYNRAVIHRKLAHGNLNSKSQPLYNSGALDQNNNTENCEESDNGSSLIGPLHAFTAESIDILNIANENIDFGKQLRQNSHALIRDALENSKLYSNCINDTFKRQIDETLVQSKYLNVNSASNRLSQNRAQRWLDQNSLAFGYSLGPEKYTNLKTYEVLDRPIMKSFQKHPGNQVPEAQEIIKESNQLNASVEKSKQNIRALKIIGQKLDSSARSKEVQVSLDSALLRRRRELSDHRWTSAASKYIK